MEEKPLFITPKEFADRLRVALGTVYDSVSRNEIPHCRIGRTIRIPKQFLDDLCKHLEDRHEIS